MQSILKPDQASNKMRWLVVMATLFMSGTALSGTFINVYIWKIDRTYEAITWFNLFTYGCLPLAFTASGYLATWIGEAWVMRSGVIVLVIFFSLLLWLGPKSIHYVQWLGMFFGIGQGMYWFSFHVLSFDFTNPDSRGKFNGLTGLFASLASMTGPYIAGYLIVHVRQISGYHAVFALSFFLFALLFFATFRLPLMERPQIPKISRALQFAKDPDWRRLVAGSVVFGIREGLFSFLIALLVFDAAKSEEGLGLYGLWTGLISLVAFFLATFIGKHKKWPKWSMGIAAVLLGCTPFVFIQSVSTTTLLIFGLITGFVLPFFIVPLGTMIMNEIDESFESAKYRAEHLSVREMALGLGRISGISFFLWIVVRHHNLHYIPRVLMVLGFAQVVVFLLTFQVRFTDRKKVTNQRRVLQENDRGERSLKYPKSPKYR